MKTKIEQICPVCESDLQAIKYEPWVDEDDPDKLYGAASGIPGTQRLVSCLTCGMIYESPRYSAKTIVQGYMASQEAGHDSQFHMRINSFLQTLKKHAKHLPLPGSNVFIMWHCGYNGIRVGRQMTPLAKLDAVLA